MHITKQTASELVIHSPIHQKELILPLSMLGVMLIGFGFMAISGWLVSAASLFLAATGAYGLYMIYQVLRSETLTFDKVASEVRCDRTTLLGTKRWEFPLSTLQKFSVVTYNRLFIIFDFNRATRLSYTLKLTAADTQPKSLIYQADGDSVDYAYHTIKKLVGSFAVGSSNEPHYRMTVTPDYRQWRETIFNLEPAGVPGSGEVVGVLMDVGMMEEATSEQWAMSMTAFLSGEASFQPTVGGGSIGLGSDPNVANVVQEIVQIAQTLLPKASPIEDRALPEVDLVQFFFFTAGGVYSVTDYVQNLQTSSDPLSLMLNRFGLIRQSADRLQERR